MAGLTDDVRAFLDQQPVGVLGTTRADGSVRQSVVYHVLEEDRVLISTESKRAKASLLPNGRVESHRPMRGPGPPAPGLSAACGSSERSERDQERWISGTKMEEPQDQDLAAVDRVILELTIERVYGVAHLKEG